MPLRNRRDYDRMMGVRGSIRPAGDLEDLPLPEVEAWGAEPPLLDNIAAAGGRNAPGPKGWSLFDGTEKGMRPGGREQMLNEVQTGMNLGKTVTEGHYTPYTLLNKGGYASAAVGLPRHRESLAVHRVRR